MIGSIPRKYPRYAAHGLRTAAFAFALACASPVLAQSILIAASDEVTTATATVPAKPTGLTIYESANRVVEIRWTAGSDGGSAITGWKYRKKVGSNWENHWTLIPDATKRAQRVSNLTNGTTYRFKVRAVNAIGDGAESDESAAATPSDTPGQPTNLTVTGGNATVTLTWTSGGDGGAAITKWKYLKKVGDTWDKVWTDVPNSGASTTSYTVPNLTNETVYRFKVQAENIRGSGPESDESAEVTPSGATPPAKPTGLAVTKGNGTVALSWTAGSDGGSAITGWKYRKKVDNAWDATWTAVPNSGAGTTSYTVPDLTNGKAYTFKIRAVNAKGDGAESDESAAVTPSTTPAKPTGLTGTAGDTTVKLKWTSGGDGGSAITGWKYTKKVDNAWDADWTTIPSSGASTTSYTVANLTNGKAYTFKVHAVNANGDGAESDESAAVTPSTATAPAKPTSLTISDSGNRYVQLSWTAGSDGGSAITSWKYRKKVGSNWEGWRPVPGSSATTTTYRVSSLTNGTAYRFRVRAVNAIGDGAESDQSAEVTPSDTPAKPTGLTVSGGDTTVTLTWTSGGDGGATITKWRYRKEVDGTWETGWTDVPSSDADTRSYTVTNLTNGKTYKFKVQAKNARGFGPESDESAAVTPSSATPPAKPTGLTGTGGNRTVALSWTAGSDGGSPITSWKYTKKVDNAWDADWTTIPSSGATTTSYTVSSLTNGKAYTFKVRAVNARGDGAESDESDEVTPSDTPAKPTGLTVTGGDTTVKLTWTSGGNGGSAITGWKYTKKVDGDWDDNWTEVPNSGADTTSYTVPSLTNGKAYTFKVRAVNANGDGAESDESAAVTPAKPTAPAKPTGLTVEGSNRAVQLSWTAGSDGGSAITGWKYLKKVDSTWDATWTEMEDTDGSKTTYRVANLTNGKVHRFKVRAVNAIGDGAESDQSAAVTPSNSPGQPTGLTVKGGDTTVKLTWTSGGNGGAAITKWKYLKKVGDTWDIVWTDVPNSGASTTSYTVPNLTNGTVYRFKVLAANIRGDGAESAESAEVTPAKPTAPAKPTGLTVTKGDRTVALSWTAGSDGGSDITGWKFLKKVGSDWDDNWTTVPNSGASTTSYTVPNLTNGTVYKFKVRAVNAVGDGAESEESAAVTPSTTPAKPTGLTVTKGNTTVALSWTAGNNGGSAITGWKYLRKVGSDWDDDWTNVPGSGADTTTYTVTDLTNGTAYRFMVRAVNANGDGVESDQSSEVTPSTTPAKPTGLTVTRGNTTVALSWTAGNNGGSAITGWKYLKKVGSDWDDDWTEVPSSGADTTTYTVTDLTNGTAYRFKVRAVNANGDGTVSDESAVVTPSTTPEKPTGLTATKGDETVALSWTAGGNGGAAITGWKYLKKVDSEWDDDWETVENSGADTTSHTVTKLTNGTVYRFKVRAVNANGDGTESDQSDEVTPSTIPAKPTGLAVAGGDGSATVSWVAGENGGSAITGWKYLKQVDGTWDATWTEVPNSGASTTRYTVPNLTNGTVYRFKIRAVNANGDGAESDESEAVTPAVQTLKASNIGTDGATLTIGGYTGNWHYKHTIPGDGRCSVTAETGTTASVSDLQANTRYVFRAYSDSSCSSEIATAPAFPTLPAKPEKPMAKAGPNIGQITLSSSVTGSAALVEWQYKKKQGNNDWDDEWTVVSITSTALSHPVSDLVAGTKYVFKVLAKNASGESDESDPSDAVQPRQAPAGPGGGVGGGAGGGPALASGEVTETTAVLTVTGWQSAWWYMGDHDGAQCTAVPAGTPTAALSDLTGDTTYVFRIYSAAGCNADDLIATSPAFTTPVPLPPPPTLEAGEVTETTAELTVGNWQAAWWHRSDQAGAQCTPIAADTATASVAGLTGDTTYIYSAYRAAGCGDADLIATAPAFTTVGLAAGAITETTAELTIANWPAAWWHRGDQAGAPCTAIATETATASVTGLAAGTRYTYTAYRAAGCATADAIADETFATRKRAVAGIDPKGWIVRFVRTVAGHIVEALSDRFSSADAGSQVTLAGERLDLSSPQPSQSGPVQPAPAADGLLGDDAGETRSMTADELVLGSSFHVASQDEHGGPVFAAWGRTATGRFDADAGGVSVNGDVTTVTLGADIARDRWLAGVALSRSTGKGSSTRAGPGNDREARAGSRMTGVWPYARLQTDEGVSAWGVLGYGSGNLALSGAGLEAPAEVDLSMAMAAVGARGVLLPAPAAGGFELAVKTDAFLARTESDAAPGVEAAEGEASRLRVLLDASREIAVHGGSLTPRFEVGLRLDDGDAETGAGLEAGAGLGYAADGVSVEGSIRGLAAHEVSDYGELGAGLAVRVDPGTEGRGLSLMVAPSWGGAADGAERLWSLADAGDLVSPEELGGERRLDAEVGFGLPGSPGVVTPYMCLGLVDGGERNWRAGVRWQLAPDVASVRLEGTRREMDADDPTEHGFAVHMHFRW